MVACAGLPLVVVGAASANASEAEPVVHDTATYSAADLEDAVVDNGRKADQFVDDQAAAGRLIDLEEVNTSVLPDVTLVWEDSQNVEKAVVDNVVNPDDSDEGSTAVGIETTDNDSDAVVVNEASGTGLEASFNGASYVTGGCSTATVGRGKMTYCSNKYKVKENGSDYNFYFYDRWITANGSVVNNGPDNNPTKIDVRTRPAQGGGNIQKIVSYTPKNAVKSCNDVGTLGVSGTGFSASIPFSECDELAPYPDASTSVNLMRVVYDQGSIFGGRTHAAEMGVVYRTAGNKDANTANYNYTKFCAGTYLSCDTVTKTSADW